MFEEYVLIHQKQVLVERFQRKSDNLWIPYNYQEGSVIEFSSIGFTCAVAHWGRSLTIATLYENLSQLL